MKYFILRSDSLVESFSEIQAGNQFNFKLESTFLTSGINISKEDLVLVFSEDGLFYGLEVLNSAKDELAVSKNFEIQNPSLDLDYRLGEFEEISKDKYDEICFKIFKHYLQQNKEEQSSFLLDKFADWFIRLDKRYFDLLFKSDKSVLIEKLREYEKAYSKDFKIRIFQYPMNSIESIIEALKTNVIDSEGEIGALNKKTPGNGAVKAILGPNNYIKFLEEFKIIDTDGLNKILYGPPGTGKTFSTIDKVVKLVDPLRYSAKDHISNKFIYDQLFESKKVFFTTFHQSMSYEDFVEGIKPKIDDDSEGDSDQLSYVIAPGIFKIACARAAYNTYIQSRRPSVYTFNELYEAFLEEVVKGIDSKVYRICKTITGKDVEIFKVNRNDSIHARAQGSSTVKVASLTKENIQKLYDNFESIEEIKNLDQVREVVGVTPRITEFYAVFNSLLEFQQKEFTPDFSEGFIEELTDEEIVRQFDAGIYSKAVREAGLFSEPVVLVIDEINRGNVPSILGELITLIEPDKRMGQENEIQVILPYSKKNFTVPPNLYLLGTMNTADRNVEALDSALRRRFNFEEIMPDEQLLEKHDEVEGFKLSEILKVINERIEVLINRDHTIGHAYLWNVKSLADLKSVFHNKIIPLLQEYFFGNYAKLELVIGPDFFNQDKKSRKVEFAVNSDDLDFETVTRYELLNVDNFSDSEMIHAIESLLGKPEETEQEEEG